jgi:hypothetical protein
MSATRVPDAAWRRSYDVAAPQAQVFATHWPESAKNEHALKFFDVLKQAAWRYSAHIREHGKHLPISANAKAVLEALLRFMDGKTGRCDPCLDRLASQTGLSRRTVVRAVQTLRHFGLINWVRRTELTGKERGEGPKRRQISNAYFIDLAKLPIEILRTLRQKLGDKLRETARSRQGSGPVPSRMASNTAKLVSEFKGAMATSLGREAAQSRALAGSSQEQRLAHMYRNDPDGLRQHLEMLGLSSCPSASANMALYPSSRTEGKVD